MMKHNLEEKQILNLMIMKKIYLTPGYGIKILSDSLRLQIVITGPDKPSIELKYPKGY